MLAFASAFVSARQRLHAKSARQKTRWLFHWPRWRARNKKKKNENNEETGRGVIEKRERASTLFQAPTSVFSLSCLRSLRVLAFPSSFYPLLQSSPIQERARRFSATWMERFANGLSSGQTVECHRKKRKARVGGKVCEVTRALETGTK